MVNAQKLLVFSLVSVSGTLAALQDPRLAHSGNVNSHHSLADRQKTSFVKVQKRSAESEAFLDKRLIGGLADGLGSGINGAASTSGSPDSTRAASTPGQAQASTTQAATKSMAPASSANAAQPSNGSTGSTNNNNTTDNDGNNGANNGGESVASQGSNTAYANAGSTGAAVSSVATESGNSMPKGGAESAAASASAVQGRYSATSGVFTGAPTAAAISSSALPSGASSDSSTSTTAIASTRIMTLSNGDIVKSTATSVPNIVTAATKNSSNNLAVRIAAPIVVVLAMFAIAGIGFVLFRRSLKKKEDMNPDMLPPNFGRYSGESTYGLHNAAVPIGGASDAAHERHQRFESTDSFEAGRPMSTLMQEKVDYSRLGTSTIGASSFPAPPALSRTPSALSSTPSRLRNYNSGVGVAIPDLRHSIDSESDYSHGHVTETGHDAYNVNSYDRNSNIAYYNASVRGTSTAATSSHPYHN